MKIRFISKSLIIKPVFVDISVTLWSQTHKIQYKSDVYLRCSEQKYKLTDQEKELNDDNEEKGDDDLDNDSLDNRIDPDDDNDGSFRFDEQPAELTNG
jgi:hypothetical protein